jgi:hypothetical protein
MIYNYLYLLQLKIPTMKKAKAIILGITISIGIHSYAQVSEPYGSLLFEDTLSLDPIHEWITIPSQESNIWQVGRSNKGILSESNMQDAVLITIFLFPFLRMKTLCHGQREFYPSIISIKRIP